MKNFKYFAKIGLCLNLLFVLFSCNDFTNQVGNVVNKEKSEYYHYGTYDKNKVFYFSNLFVGDTPKELENVDKETFEIISKYWAKDKNTFYYKNFPISNVDYETFTVESIKLEKLNHQDENKLTTLLKDKNNVYLIKDIPKSGKLELQIIENADPLTYQIISKEYANWAKDKNHIFLNDKKFDADLSSFEMLNTSFSKDKNKLYFLENNWITSENVNTDELKVLNLYYIRTNSNVYFFKNKEIQKIDLKDEKSVKVFNSNALLLKADDKLFINGNQFTLEGLDYSKFEHINNQYFTDGKTIFYSDFNSDNLIKTTADVASFSTIENSNFGKDNKHVYYRDKIVDEANPKSFRYDEKTKNPYDEKATFIYDDKTNNYIKQQK
ncbi:DKNYY domain-containing protein [Flavobacterium sp. I3-2]|uniref:DKNYY domain-containing protein n=1 Tax=Flavobacterium sp. I3-2 TaxID=2748319 RepID=UPI0015A8E324|nr:DKNYY domain-containing protein [Flavobacterium sp. I3-2]